MRRVSYRRPNPTQTGLAQEAAHGCSPGLGYICQGHVVQETHSLGGARVKGKLFSRDETSKTFHMGTQDKGWGRNNNAPFISPAPSLFYSCSLFSCFLLFTCYKTTPPFIIFHNYFPSWKIFPFGNTPPLGTLYHVNTPDSQLILIFNDDTSLCIFMIEPC
jgi:hypothetical protein